VSRYAPRRFAPESFQLTDITYLDIEAQMGLPSDWLEILEQIEGEKRERNANTPSRRGR
jgi:hypothetical protein